MFYNANELISFQIRECSTKDNKKFYVLEVLVNGKVVRPRVKGNYLNYILSDEIVNSLDFKSND